MRSKFREGLLEDSTSSSVFDPSLSASAINARKYIRHPSSVPIHFHVIESGHIAEVSAARNVSRGGLSFQSDVPLPKGTRLNIEIPIDRPPFEARAVVVWSQIDDAYFTIGVEFEDESLVHSVRMVEQVCYIEHYRKFVAETEGRLLSSEDAAQEWVSLYAADFPRH
jgi:hypothetical protein